jgi:hypothetical protein
MEEIVCRHGILVSLSPTHIIHPRYQNVADPFVQDQKIIYRIRSLKHVVPSIAFRGSD